MHFTESDVIIPKEVAVGDLSQDVIGSSPLFRGQGIFWRMIMVEGLPYLKGLTHFLLPLTRLQE